MRLAISKVITVTGVSLGNGLNRNYYDQLLYLNAKELKLYSLIFYEFLNYANNDLFFLIFFIFTLIGHIFLNNIYLELLALFHCANTRYTYPNPGNDGTPA